MVEIEQPITEANKPYAPRGAVEQLFGCRDSEQLLEGPAGTGKSRGLCELSFMVATHFAGCRILFVRQTRESMTESILVTFEDHVVPAAQPIPTVVNNTLCINPLSLE